MSEYPKIMYEQNGDSNPESVTVFSCDCQDGCTIPTYLYRRFPGGLKFRCSMQYLFNTEQEVLAYSINEYKEAIVVNQKEILSHHAAIEQLAKRVYELEAMRNKL